MSSYRKIMRKQFTFKARQHQISLGTHTQIMGIINVTPDSFSQDGCMTHTRNFTDKAYRQALKQLREGAHLIDVGGESTRPGSKGVDAKEEIRRIVPVIQRLAKHNKGIISADTSKTIVAKAALDSGAHIINNIKGSRPSPSLLKMIARYHAGIVLMHIGSGTPRTMQQKIQYKDVITDILRSLRESIKKCLENGIKSDKIMIDPGIGFGKTVAHNLIIMNRLKEFSKLHQPILLGTSRKSFIGHTLNRDIGQRLAGTAATIAFGIQQGAHVVRVHDVKSMADVAKMTDAMLNTKAL